MRRPGLTSVQLLIVLAVIGFILGFMMAAIAASQRRAREVAALNNLAEIQTAVLLHCDAYSQCPSGNDQNNYSALAHLLPYLDQDDLHGDIDFKKPVDDPANDKARRTAVSLFMSNRDPAAVVRDARAPSSYMFNAGTKPGLKDNDGVFYQDSRVDLVQLANADGLSRTAAIVENLVGDGGKQAVDVRRQHVVLTREALRTGKPPARPSDQQLAALIADLDSKEFPVREKASAVLEKLGAAILPDLRKVLAGKPTLELRQRVESLVKKAEASLDIPTELKDDLGQAEWKAGRNIAGDRGGSWMDGRFLQTTFTATRPPNDERADVGIEGLGGLSSVRSLDGKMRVVFCDRHVQILPANIDFKIWKAIMTRNGQEEVQLP
jgi:hypothetical protein